MDRFAAESAMVESAPATGHASISGEVHGRQDTEATTQAEEAEGPGPLIRGGPRQGE